MTALNEIEVAWAAGFWEGEGYVYAWKHRAKPGGKEYVYLKVGASQKEPEPLEKLFVLFGGNRIHRSSNIQRIWRWGATGATADVFLDAIWPHLSQRRREQITRVRAEVAEAPKKRGYTRRAEPSLL